jgi:hypothetical protein
MRANRRHVACLLSLLCGISTTALPLATIRSEFGLREQSTHIERSDEVRQGYLIEQVGISELAHAVFVYLHQVIRNEASCVMTHEHGFRSFSGNAAFLRATDSPR